MRLKLREIRCFFQISQVFHEIRVVPFVERWTFSDFFGHIIRYITAINNKEVCLYDYYINVNYTHRPILLSLFTLNPQCHRVINKTSALSDSPT